MDPVRVPKFDKRLLGTWKSDREKTFEHWKPLPGVTRAQVKKLQNIFGKLTIHYTRKYFYSWIDEGDGADVHRDRFEYELLGKDAGSAVIRYADSAPSSVLAQLFSDENLRQIQFDGPDGYFIMLSPGLNEYFRRVDSR